MFKDKNIFDILHSGGLTMYVLIFCSILSLAVIIERLFYYYRRSRVSRPQLMEKIRVLYTQRKLYDILELCRNTDTPHAKVALAAFNLHGHDEKVISNAMEREITVQTIELERFTSIVATIGGTAVYIGLFGTVLGIMRAFGDIAKASSGGMDVVTAGIAEALICTATGLLVAIPAVVSYNVFMRKIDTFVVHMELIASELLDLMSGGKPK